MVARGILIEASHRVTRGQLNRASPPDRPSITSTTLPVTARAFNIAWPKRYGPGTVGHPCPAKPSVTVTSQATLGSPTSPTTQPLPGRSGHSIITQLLLAVCERHSTSLYHPEKNPWDGAPARP